MALMMQTRFIAKVLEEIFLRKFKTLWISKPKQDIQGARNARKGSCSVLKFYRNRSPEKEAIMALVKKN